MHLFDSEDASRFFRKRIDKDRVNAYKEALRYITGRIKSYCEARGGHYLLVPSYRPLFEVFFGSLADMEVVK